MSEFACLQWDSETGNGINLTIQTWLPFFPARPFSRRPPAGVLCMYGWSVCFLVFFSLCVSAFPYVCIHIHLTAEGLREVDDAFVELFDFAALLFVHLL